MEFFVPPVKARDPIPFVVDGVRSLSMSFQMAVRAHVYGTIPQALSIMQEALERTGGMVFGETHGMYSHADFISDFIPRAGESGADRFYVEMFTQRQQGDINTWQDRGDKGALAWLLNHLPAHSEHMRLYYWKMLTAARDSGLRVVGIEPDNKPVFYPGTNIWARNMMWENAIEADQKAKGGAQKPFLVVCGAHHLDPYRCGYTTPLHKWFEVAGIRLGNGRPCLVPPLRRHAPAYMSLPRHAGQTKLMEIPKRNAGARVPVEGPVFN